MKSLMLAITALVLVAFSAAPAATTTPVQPAAACCGCDQPCACPGCGDCNHCVCK